LTDIKSDPRFKGWLPNFAALAMSALIMHSSLQLISPFVSIYLLELGATQQEAVTLAGIMNTFSPAFMVFAQPLWGSMADRFGRKRLILRAMLGLQISWTLMGYAIAPWMVVGVRLFQGVATGANSAMLALAAQTLPPARLGFGMGIMQSAQGLAQSLGPLIGGLLVAAVGFRSTFGIATLGVAMAILAVIWRVRDAPKAVGRKEERKGMKEGLAIVLRTPNIRVPILGVAAYQGSYLASQQLMPLHLYSLVPDEADAARAVGLVLASTAIGTVLGAASTGWLSSRLSAKVLVLGTMGLSGAVLATQFFLTEPVQFMAVRFVLGLCAGGALPALRTALVEQARIDGRLRDSLGTLYGYSQSAFHFGGSLGAALAATVASVFGLAAVYLSSGTILLVAATLWAINTRGPNWRKGAAGAEVA
jgi:DHA1 family multidrug resistance protein-like MFS transporter